MTFYAIIRDMCDISPPIAPALLEWYDRHGRELPWRSKGGQIPDPYHVWLSEIMLQQTTVAAVGPYFAAFLARWPNIEALAAAPLDDVLVRWAGLGYYARARNLHGCARALVAQHGGKFPQTEDELRQLPGIGDYTAAAIAAIAFNRRAAVMDGNIERVVSRLFAIDEPLPGAKPLLKRQVLALTPRDRPGDFAQAAMDLGAMICTPRKPACAFCPLHFVCLAAKSGIAETLPVKAAKKERPTRYGLVFWLQDQNGAVLLRRRPERGLLGGMMEFPSSEWREQPWSGRDAEGQGPIAADWRKLPGVVPHSFTHFHLQLELVTARAAKPAGIEGIWCQPAELRDLALPTLMRKVAKHAQKHG